MAKQSSAARRSILSETLGPDDAVTSTIASIVRAAALSGTAGDDQLEGTSSADTISGADGDDRIHGNGGDDTIYGGAGADVISGNAGEDTIYGNRGADDLSGGKGDDRLAGDNGNDWLDGGNDDDTLFGGSGRDALLGGKGRDELHGEGGDDLLALDPGKDTIDGGDGFDVVGDFGDFPTAGVTIDLGKTGGQDTGFGTDTIVNVEGIWGSRKGDTLKGNDHDNFILGDSGNDVIRGKGGDDMLSGDEGRDKVYGGSGVDLIDGGFGKDVLKGGSGGDYIGGGGGRDKMFGGGGDDTFIFYDGDSGSAAADRDVVKDFVRGEDLLAMSDFDQAMHFSGTTAEAHGAWYTTYNGGVTLRMDTDGNGTGDFRVDLAGLSKIGAADIMFGHFDENDVDPTPFQDEGLWDFLMNGFGL